MTSSPCRILLSRPASFSGRAAAPAARPEAKRWASAPGVLETSGKFLDIPNFEAAHAFKARCLKSKEDVLAHASEKTREDLLFAFVRATAHSDASLDALEALMLEAARAFDLKVTVVRRRGAITCLVGERTGKRRYIRVVSPVVRRAYFSGLIEVRRVYAAVVDGGMRVAEAREALAAMCAKTPVRFPAVQLVFAGLLSGLMCLLVAGGASGSAVVAAMVGTVVLGLVQYMMRRVDRLAAEFLELLITVTISLLAHDSLITPTLISILPGYLYLCGTLKRMSRYTRPEYISAVFVAMYTVVLALGLPVILDLFLMTKLFAMVIVVKKMWSSYSPRAAPVKAAV